MEVEVTAEAKDKRLNRLVALTVVILSIVTGLSGVKDGNIVQAMEQAESSAVDTWGQYQATKLKLHVDENALAELAVINDLGHHHHTARITKQVAHLSEDIQKYKAEIPKLKAKAEGFHSRYDALNIHDDQFDAADAFLSIAISIAAVAALTESFPVLYTSWVFGSVGLIMAASGFLSLGLHSNFLSQILG